MGAVDGRHVDLLVDAMTYTGEVHGMNYHGFRGESVLGNACFQRALKGMFEAASEGRREGSRENVSARVSAGLEPNVGTGTVRLVGVVEEEEGGPSYVPSTPPSSPRPHKRARCCERTILPSPYETS